MTIRLPAEWEPQSAIMLTWPHPATDWQPWLHDVEPVYTEISRQISRYEKIIIVCHDADHRVHVGGLLCQAGIPAEQYRLYIAPSNDTWARDHGPVTVLADGKPVLLDFTFNGWGNKYPAELDNRITATLHQAGAFGKTSLRTFDFVLEGGSIETDGQGTLLTTASCLLSARRNHGMGKSGIEARLTEYLGADRILWFHHGQLPGDDTDGHIDTLIRFADPETLLYAAANDKNDPDFESLRLMPEELKQLRQKNGKPYRLVALPSPVIRNDNGDYLPASYVNFLIINHAVLVPVYGVRTDEQAINTFSECFVDRQVIAINCRPLIEQYGSLHCITMQFPEGVVT
jgi:agmatine/peptidylarginine deiminase